MRWPWLLLALALAARPAPADGVFVEDFETGNLFRWSARLGEDLAPAEAFRFSDLDLRDPHVFVEVPLIGCVDFTDEALPFGLGPSLNAQLESAIGGDADPPDGLLDASYLLVFRPFEPLGLGLRLDLQSASCTAPEATTSCAWNPESVPQTTRYDGVAAGTCLEPLPGVLHPYAPAVATPVAPCFVSVARPIRLGLAGLGLPLTGVRVAATGVGVPVDDLADGLLIGFLAESDADQIPLPADLPVVGGEPLSILLPGGTGNCADHDDRDLRDGVSGWWFHLNFPARRVALAE